MRLQERLTSLKVSTSTTVKPDLGTGATLSEGVEAVPAAVGGAVSVSGANE